MRARALDSDEREHDETGHQDDQIRDATHRHSLPHSWTNSSTECDSRADDARPRPRTSGSGHQAPRGRSAAKHQARTNANECQGASPSGEGRRCYEAPHTSRATSRASPSLRFWSSTVTLLPWCVLEKPHCGLRQRCSSGTYFAADSMRRLRSSFDSSAGTFELISPSTTV